MDNCLVVLREMAVSLLLLLSLITNIQGLEQVPTNYDYALQRKPITFITLPESQVTFTQDTLILHCKVTLWSKFDIVLQWGHDGQLVHENEDRVTVLHSRSDETVSSELQISNVSSVDEGRYECLALDGIDSSGNAVMITASPAAKVRVLGHTLTSETVEVNKGLGQYVILDCNWSEVEDILWTKDGSSLIPTDSVMLRNGSLLINNVTQDDEAIYQCSFTISGHQLAGPKYNLSLTDTTAVLEPRVLTDPASIIVSSENQFSVTCCVLGLDSMQYQLTLSKTNRATDLTEILQLSDSTSHCKAVTQELGQGSYKYKCTAQIAGRDTIFAVSEVIVEDVPAMIASERTTDIFKSTSVVRVNLECPVQSGSNLIFRWYRNGVDITEYSDATNGNLQYIDSLGSVAVYQCFAENSVGSDYATIRRVEIGFANPPGNFTCHAVDSVNSLPQAVLSWSPPDFSTIPITSYLVVFESQYKFTSSATMLEIELNKDQLAADFSVAALSPVTIEKDSKKELCQIADTLERRYDPANARAALVTCPTDLTHGNISWDNPRVSFDFLSGLSLPLDSYHIRCRCLYEELVTMCGDAEQSGWNIVTPSVSLTVEPQPLGSLCVVGGDYMLRNNDPLVIPPEICIHNTSTYVSSQVIMTCEESLVTVAVNSSILENSIQVKGSCLLADINTVIYINETLSSANSQITVNHSLPQTIYINGTLSSVSYNLPEITACSFVLSHLDVGVQCVMDQLVSLRQLNIEDSQSLTDMNVTATSIHMEIPTTSEEPEPESATSMHMASTTTSEELELDDGGVHQAVIGAVVQTFVLILLVTAVSLLVTLLVCWKKKQKLKRKQMWHKAVQTVTDNIKLDDSNDYEDRIFPTKTVPDDAVSNVTVCENLSSEKKSIEMQNNFVFTRLLCDNERFHPASETTSIALNRPQEVPSSDSWWRYLQQTSAHHHKKYFNSSNSSGYETESDTNPESREYFFARDVEFV